MLSRRTLAATLPAAGIVAAIPLPSFACVTPRRPPHGLIVCFYARCLSAVDGMTDDQRHDTARAIADDLAARPVPVGRMARLLQRGPMPAAEFWEEHAALSRGAVVPLYDLGLGMIPRDAERAAHAIQNRHFAALWVTGTDPAACAVACIKRSFEETDAAFGLETRLTLEPAEFMASLRAIRTKAGS